MKLQLDRTFGLSTAVAKILRQTATGILKPKLFISVFAALPLILATGFAQAQPTPIGHWTFDEASSGTGTGTVLDSSPGAHDGTIQGGNSNGPAVYVPGVVGTGALNFNGDDRVDFGLVPALDLTGGSYTIAFWLKYNETQLGRIINMDDAANCTGGYSVFLSNAMRTTHNNGGCNDTSTFFSQPPFGDFVHVAVVYDSSAQTITTYYDGVSQGAFSKFPPITPLTTDGNDPLLFGTYNSSNSQGLKGTLDDVRIYNVALSAAEIAQLISDDGNGDGDGDGVIDTSDNCPAIANTDQADNDSDTVGDVCDNDDDNDGVDDTADNCPTTLGGNADQTDTDMDGAGDLCDSDLDGDGVNNATDNCPIDPNTLQEDNDGDLAGDACDTDDDNDGVLDNNDNCPINANPDQADSPDGDGIGNLCDADDDNDGTNDDVDNCPVDANAGQDDIDGDLLGDVCDPDDDNDGVLDGGDNCQATFNPDQTNTDGTGGGDACDQDDDDDGVLDGGDNCPLVSNAAQSDFDGDGAGDACDSDVDNDGVANGSDICGFTTLGEVVDPALGCSIAELCPCDGPRGTTNDWRNHGKYVSCVAKTSKSFAKEGLISDAARSDIVSAAGQSDCGK